MQLAHETIARNLGQDRSRHDRALARVAADPGFGRAGRSGHCVAVTRARQAPRRPRWPRPPARGHATGRGGNVVHRSLDIDGIHVQARARSTMAHKIIHGARANCLSVASPLFAAGCRRPPPDHRPVRRRALPASAMWRCVGAGSMGVAVVSSRRAIQDDPSRHHMAEDLAARQVSITKLCFIAAIASGSCFQPSPPRHAFVRAVVLHAFRHDVIAASTFER